MIELIITVSTFTGAGVAGWIVGRGVGTWIRNRQNLG
jgi:hypothetical protein